MHINYRLMGTLGHVYVAARLVPALGLWPLQLAGLALIAFGGWLMPRIINAPLYKNGKPDPLVIMSSLWMGLFSSIFILVIARDVGLLGVHVFAFFQPGSIDLAAASVDSAMVVVGVALAATAIGYRNARRTAGVLRVDIPIEGLSPALEGFTIAQISDLHIGPTIRAPMVERLVKRVNDLQAHVVAITGDLVDGGVADLVDHVAPLAKLRARQGVYLVTGNHEYYAGGLPWVEHFKSLGLHVLINEHVVLRAVFASAAQTDEEEGDNCIVFAGITDFEAGHFVHEHKSDPFKALDGAPHSACVRILLAHQPRSAMTAEAAGFDLQLSGHTHGGQFWPWNHFVRLQQPFTAGLHKMGKMLIYVSRGTGYWGPPKRLGAPNEIALLRLVRKIE